ncbi:MAG: hypothetical protein K8H86_10155 [Ignavibacteriaceae bacterium]|nr:hypothetical protein [Ignavibacteriaceae bacterium]
MQIVLFAEIQDERCCTFSVNPNYTIQTEHFFTEDNKQKFRTVIEQLINGEMKVIKDTVEWKKM